MSDDATSFDSYEESLNYHKTLPYEMKSKYMNESDDSTEESDNGVESPIEKKQSTLLNKNSNAFYIKVKKDGRNPNDPMKSEYNSNFIPNLESQQIGNVGIYHPKSDGIDEKVNKDSDRSKQKTNPQDCQDVTIKKPRRKFA